MGYSTAELQRLRGEADPLLRELARLVKHEPGDPHQYKITCTVCGESGTVRITVDPETSEEKK